MEGEEVTSLTNVVFAPRCGYTTQDSVYFGDGHPNLYVSGQSFTHDHIT